jgi:hypothetical protein
VAAAVERILVDPQLPLVRRLAHCLRFCNLLAQCHWKRVKSAKLADLMQVLTELADRDLGELFRVRQQPSKRTARLFRRLGAHFIRCFPGGPPIRTLAHQWQVMRLSGRLARGGRTLPRLHPRFAAIDLSLVERPLGPLPADVLKPLGRFYESHAVSKRYVLAQPGVSLVDSACRLVFAFPMSLWMLRWLAADRAPAADDMVQIVVALERGIALPALHRAARYLADSGQLERLIAWYAR